jgi:plasmid stabilization system protein ParE
MIENVVILPEAVDDLVEARAWYEDRSSGLGERFLSHVDDCIECIQENPELYERVYKDYRRAMVHRFPYVVFYEFTGDTIVVYSAFHTAQDAQKWRKRLT